MNEFMTRMSDYFSERRNDPEKNKNPLVFCMLGVVILVVIILCLLLLWHKSTGKKEKEGELITETFEKKSEIIMSAPDENEILKQQYLDNVGFLNEKVEDLLQSMTAVKETLEETILLSTEEDMFLKEQITEVEREIGNLILRLQNTQNYLYDLTDMIQIMNTETVPAIQEQIGEFEAQMRQTADDITNIYAKIGALETSDDGLSRKIRELEGNLKTSVEQNLTDITNRFESMHTQIKQVEMQIGNVETQIGDVETRIGSLETRIAELQTQMQQFHARFLHYRYDKTTNTLYLSGNP